MNTSTQPPEGAGGSRSRAAGELTLGLMSGEKQWVYAALLFCGNGGAAIRLARDDGFTANQPFTDVPNPIVGASLLAMAAQQSTIFIAQASHSDPSHKTFRLPVGSTVSSL
jgi:hypothetical protein